MNPAVKVARPKSNREGVRFRRCSGFMALVLQSPISLTITFADDFQG